jgi:hypothetical protein
MGAQRGIEATLLPGFGGFNRISPNSKIRFRKLGFENGGAGNPVAPDLAVGCSLSAASSGDLRFDLVDPVI